jgi:hypothetical protein
MSQLLQQPGEQSTEVGRRETKQIELEAEQRLTTTKDLVLAIIAEKMEQFADLETRIFERWEIIEKMMRIATQEPA